MRSCDAFGVTELILVKPEGSFNPFNRAFSLISGSSNKWVCCRVTESTAECAELLRTEGYLNVATICSESSKPLFEAQELIAPKLAIWLGNEHRGLSEQAVELADAHLHIPMRGMVQSLNLSVSAAIFLAEVSRMRQHQEDSAGVSDTSFVLNQSDQEALTKVDVDAVAYLPRTISDFFLAPSHRHCSCARAPAGERCKGRLNKGSSALATTKSSARAAFVLESIQVLRVPIFFNMRIGSPRICVLE
jgi:tRNA C32,U32 (ribose-2'-O)-methylase TrmJ